MSRESTKKPQNKQKHPTKTRQTRTEKMSSTIYSMIKPLVLFSPWYLDTASIECRDLILPLRAQQTNKQTNQSHQRKHSSNKSKTNKQKKYHTHKTSKERFKSHTKSKGKQRDYPLLHFQI